MSSIGAYLFLIIFSTCYAQVLSSPSISGPNIPSGLCPTIPFIHNYTNHIFTFIPSTSCHYVDVHLTHTSGELNYRMSNTSTSTSYTKIIPSGINVTSYWFTYQTNASVTCDTTVYMVSTASAPPTSTPTATATAPPTSTSTPTPTPTPTTTPTSTVSRICPAMTFTHNYTNHIFTFNTSTTCHYVDVHIRHTKRELNYRMSNTETSTSTSTSYTKIIPSGINVTSYWFTYRTSAGIACDTAVYSVSIPTATPTPTPTPTPTSTPTSTSPVSHTTPTPTSGPGVCPAMTFLHNYTNHIITFNTSTSYRYVDVHLRHTKGELNYRMYDASTSTSTSYTKTIPLGINVTSYWFTYQTSAGIACDTNVYMVSTATTPPTPTPTAPPTSTVSRPTTTPTSAPTIPSVVCPAMTFTHNYTNHIFTFSTSSSCHYVDVHLRHTKGELNYRMSSTYASTSTSHTKIIPLGINVTSYWFTYQTSAGTACDTNVYMVSIPTATPTPTVTVSSTTPTPTSGPNLLTGVCPAMTFLHNYTNYIFTFNTSTPCNYVDVHLRHTKGELNYRMYYTSTSTSTSYTKIIPSGINVTSYWFTYQTSAGTACDTNVYMVPTATAPPTSTPTSTVSRTTPTATTGPNIPSGVCPAITFIHDYINPIITFTPSTTCLYVDVHLRHTKGELNYRMYDASTSTSTSTSYTKIIPSDVNVTSYWFTYQTNVGRACDTIVYMVSTATPTPTPTAPSTSINSPSSGPNIPSGVCPTTTFLHNYTNHIITFISSTSCHYVDVHLRHTSGELNYRMSNTSTSTSTSYSKIIPSHINVTSYWFTYQTSAGIACDTAVYRVGTSRTTSSITPSHYQRIKRRIMHSQ